MTKGKKVLMGVILGLIVLVVIGLIIAPGILRSMKASALAAAIGPAAVDQRAKDYLIQVDYQPGYMREFFTGYPGASIDTKLRLVELADELTEGRVATLDVVTQLTANPSLPVSERTKALSLAAKIFNENKHKNAFVPRDILVWANPERSVNQEQRAQAQAAMELLVQLNARKKLRVAETLQKIADNPSQDSVLVENAMGHLADVLTSRNVGYGLNLLLGPNADVASRSEKLLGGIYNNVQANEIAAILRLWESPIHKVASFGYRTIGAPGGETREE